MSTATNHEQRVIALFGCEREFSDTPRGKWLATILHLRSLRSWITPGCYAWWRFNDDIERAQSMLAATRSPSPPSQES